MKYLSTVMALTAIILFVGCATDQTPHPGSATVQTTYEILGMDCPGCHGGLEKNLKKIPGVTSASANWKKQTVTITTEGERQIDLSEIRKAVEQSNFTFGKALK